ncbi:MAG TPA: hypothetical protein VK208_10950 [Pyrinomonadaceae bacterium]|jgi:hypothetical protein|nr:hypothetical protein [Pyrinomonadaceae bacterium]
MNNKRINRKLWWEATGAVCCFGGGIIAALIGSILTAVTWVIGAQMHPWVRGLGTALLILTIPLLILAGYCMDWMERDKHKPASRAEQQRTLVG